MLNEENYGPNIDGLSRGFFYRERGGNLFAEKKIVDFQEAP